MSGEFTVTTRTSPLAWPTLPNSVPKICWRDMRISDRNLLASPSGKNTVRLLLSAGDDDNDVVVVLSEVFWSPKREVNL